MPKGCKSGLGYEDKWTNEGDLTLPLPSYSSIMEHSRRMPPLPDPIDTVSHANQEAAVKDLTEIFVCELIR